MGQRSPEGPRAETKVDLQAGRSILPGVSLGGGRTKGVPPPAPRRSRELQPAGGRGWNTEGTGLSPAPGPAVRLVKGAVPSPEALSGGGGRWLLGHQPCWSLLPARRRGRPSQSTYPLNVYRLAVRAGLPTAHVVVVVFIYIYIYFFLIFFTKKKILYKQSIYGFL